MFTIELKNGNIIKTDNLRKSNSGKSYVYRSTKCTCYKSICDCIIEEVIPVNDIVTINGEKIDAYIPKSIKHKGSKWTVTKVWSVFGYNWFRISGGAGAGRRYFKIIDKGQLEEWKFFRSSKKEQEKGMPLVQYRRYGLVKEEELDALREIYKLYKINNS